MDKPKRCQNRRPTAYRLLTYHSTTHGRSRPRNTNNEDTPWHFAPAPLRQALSRLLPFPPCSVAPCCLPHPRSLPSCRTSPAAHPRARSLPRPPNPLFRRWLCRFASRLRLPQPTRSSPSSRPTPHRQLRQHRPSRLLPQPFSLRSPRRLPRADSLAGC